MNKVILLSAISILLFSCGNKKEQDNNSVVGNTTIKSDTEMLTYFNNNKDDFANLAQWIMADKISHIPLFSSEIVNGKKLNVTDERLADYTRMIQKHSIVLIVFGNATKFNSVAFYMTEKKDAEQTINQGYEYRHKSELEYDQWVKTDEDLMETAKKHPLGTFVTKPIQENWNLLMLIQ